MNEAAILATRRSADTVGLDDFTQAVERVVAGLEKRNRLLNVYERRVIAHHEMGHAIVALALPGADPVHKVSIIPRGIGALGYTIQRPTEDRFLMPRDELDDKITVLLGGRAAESIVFPAITTGGGDDLAKATMLARSMVTRFGMAPDLGQVSYEGEAVSYLGSPATAQHQGCAYSEKAASAIDQAVCEIIDRLFRRFKSILERNRAVLDEGVRELLAHETLGGEQLAALASSLAIPDRRTVDAQKPEGAHASGVSAV